MDLKNKVVLLSKILVVLLIPIVLFTINVMLMINPYYVKYEYSKEDFPPSERFSEEERFNSSTQVIEYLRNTTSLDSLKETGLYAQKELEHLKNVRLLTKKFFLAQKVSVVLLVYLILFAILLDKNRWSVISFVFFGCLVSLVIVLWMFVIGYFDFNWLFTKFHEVLFPRGSWSFGSQDTLIQLYPEKFWVDSGFLLLSLIFIESLLLSAVTLVLMRRLKKTKNSNICSVKLNM